VIRRLGVRTRRVIDEQQLARKLVRGDFLDLDGDVDAALRAVRR